MYSIHICITIYVSPPMHVLYSVGRLTLSSASSLLHTAVCTTDRGPAASARDCCGICCGCCFVCSLATEEDVFFFLGGGVTNREAFIWLVRSSRGSRDRIYTRACRPSLSSSPPSPSLSPLPAATNAAAAGISDEVLFSYMYVSCGQAACCTDSRRRESTCRSE